MINKTLHFDSFYSKTRPFYFNAMPIWYIYVTPFLFGSLILYIPVDDFSVMSGREVHV